MYFEFSHKPARVIFSWSEMSNFDALSLSVSKPGEIELINEKLRVTMVCWNADDMRVITAVSDCSLKVWDSYTGELLKILQVKSLHYFTSVLMEIGFYCDRSIYCGHDKYFTKQINRVADFLRALPLHLSMLILTIWCIRWNSQVLFVI